MINATPTEALMIAQCRLENLRRVTLTRKGDDVKRKGDVKRAANLLLDIIYDIQGNAD